MSELPSIHVYSLFHCFLGCPVRDRFQKSTLDFQEIDTVRVLTSQQKKQFGQLVTESLLLHTFS